MATHLPGVWGIDLGQCGLKALRLQMVDGAVKATAFDYIEHAKILSQPDADPDQLVREALTQFLSRNSLRGDMVVISVPGQSGLARFVKLPPVEEKKIADIVKFEAKQQIPFPLEEVVWDFQKVSEGTVTEGFALETEIGLFAMKRDMVNRALLHFKDVNVEVHVIQMAPLALVNYVAYDLLTKPEGPADAGAKRDCIVALDIGTDNSNLVITDGAKIIWQRPIPLGGNHFTRALTKDLKLTFAKAEHLKRNAVKSPELKKILAALKPVLNDFVGEVQRSLGYFTNTHRDANIQFMIGLGNAFRLPGIQKYLQEKLQLEVRKLQTFDRIKGDEVLGAPQFTENIMSFGVTFGLALQGLKQAKLQTNLLPYEVRVERIVRGKKPWAVAAAAALLLMVFGLTLGHSIAKSAIDNPGVTTALKKADEVLGVEKRIRSEDNSLKDQIMQSEKAIERIGAGVNERMQWQLLMQYVNMALPQPDGRKLSTQSTAASGQNLVKRFLTAEALRALRMFEERRFAKANAQFDPVKNAADDEFIKANLVQVSIEGINTLYSENLAGFLKRIQIDTPTMRGMRDEERQQVIDDKSLPTKGYAIEVRGYTYHKEGIDFVIWTLLENLKSPDQPNVNPGLAKDRPDMKSNIMDNLGYFVVYKIAEVKNPEPGIFQLIRNSHLRTLLKGEGGGGGGGGGGQGGATSSGLGAGMATGGGSGPRGGGAAAEAGGETGPNRDGWRPLGEVAAAALGAAAGGGQSGGAPVGGVSAFGAAGGSAPPGGAVMGGGQGGPRGSAPMAPAGAQPSALPMGAAAPPTVTTITRQSRYEFVVFFVWKEPQPSLDAAKK